MVRQGEEHELGSRRWLLGLALRDLHEKYGLALDEHATCSLAVEGAEGALAAVSESGSIWSLLPPPAGAEGGAGARAEGEEGGESGEGGEGGDPTRQVPKLTLHLAAERWRAVLDSVAQSYRLHCEVWPDPKG